MRHSGHPFRDLSRAPFFFARIFGFAWNPIPKLVARGGFGIFYSELAAYVQYGNPTGYTQQTSGIITTDAGLSFINSYLSTDRTRTAAQIANFNKLSANVSCLNAGFVNRSRLMVINASPPDRRLPEIQFNVLGGGPWHSGASHRNAYKEEAAGDDGVRGQSPWPLAAMHSLRSAHRARSDHALQILPRPGASVEGVQHRCPGAHRTPAKPPRLQVSG